ncbi:MAG: FAD binding domain-containing protein [Azonexus sp.]|jgi:CO/xanthine dehydrogenase FAD-binding subunit|nr:FAD binding domain-containing protein [Azonexus sp.]
MALQNLKDFHRPDAIEDVLALLGKDEETLILAGGTFLRGLEARGLLSGVEALVDIRRVGLDKVVADNNGIKAGAAVTFTRLRGVVARQQEAWLGGLADALDRPPVQVRNVATVGGCIAAACPFFDVPTALLALDAELTIRSSDGERHLPLPELFDGLFANTLEPGEFITEVSLPRPPGNAAGAFLKLEATANDLAIVNVATQLSIDANRVCTRACVALGGGVADTAVRSAAAETILVGSRLDAAALQAAGEAVISDIDPMSDHRASAAYRRAVAKVMTRRALERAVARLA